MDSAPTSAWGAEEGKSRSHKVSPPPGELWEPATFKGLPEQSFTVKVFLYIIVINLFGVGRVASPSPFAGRASSMDAPVRPGTGRWAGSDPPADSPPQPLSCPNKGALTALGRV